MVQPLTSEQDWLDFLSSAPEWRWEKKPLVVVSPHPDDETLGAGGLIAMAREQECGVSLLAVTDGEAAYPGEADLARKREAEQRAAASALGINAGSIVRFHLPDSRVAEAEDRLCSLLETSLTANSLLVAPWPGDPHPDHGACGRAAINAARNAGAALLFYLFWTWHWVEPAALRGLPLRRFTLSPAAREARAKALDCHRSQLHRSVGLPILPDILLAPARRAFETFVLYEPVDSI